MDNGSRLSHIKLYQQGPIFFIGPIIVRYGEKSKKFILRECSGISFMTQWRDPDLVQEELENDSEAIPHEWWLGGNLNLLERYPVKRFKAINKWLADDDIEISYHPKTMDDIQKELNLSEYSLMHTTIDWSKFSLESRSLKEIIMAQVGILVEKGK